MHRRSARRFAQNLNTFQRLTSLRAHTVFSIVFAVTVARAVELKHNSSLISALANETSKLFLDAANTLRTFKPEISAQWIKYLELKAAFYQSFVSLRIFLQYYFTMVVTSAVESVEIFTLSIKIVLSAFPGLQLLR